MSFVCCVCRQLIADHVLYQCDGRHFHEHCLKCQMCRALTTDRLYAINGLLVCRNDYLALRSVCHVCRQRIDANDYRFQTRDRLSIHTQCMTCQSCHVSLTPGDKYVLSGGRVTCQKCGVGASGTGRGRGRKRGVNQM